MQGYNKERLKAQWQRVGKAFDEESRNMTINCAYEFKSLLIWNIATGKFDSFYTALDPTYKKWKEKQEGSLQGFWKLWGTLMTSFQVRPTPKGFVVEVNKAIIPTRSSSIGKAKKYTPVWEYFWYGEKGRRPFGFSIKGQPSRPVFKPTVEEYRSVFLRKRGLETLDKIRRVWYV